MSRLRCENASKRCQAISSSKRSGKFTKEVAACESNAICNESSRFDAARDFILHCLPQEVTAYLDLSDLRVSSESCVDEDPEEHFSDVTVSVRLHLRALAPAEAQGYNGGVHGRPGLLHARGIRR